MQDLTWGGTAVCALFGGTIYMRGDIISCKKNPLTYLQLHQKYDVRGCQKLKLMTLRLLEILNATVGFSGCLGGQ